MDAYSRAFCLINMRYKALAFLLDSLGDVFVTQKKILITLRKCTKNEIESSSKLNYHKECGLRITLY